ncbi:hypothetical protein [Flintibacter sp. KGMB00164]|uniref:hypothetical protein n=1 Tax=Flintibacter sp. KGMB00164 TaxID=2610895 RepID=UPI001249444E|nr:hypothetical protein [Flintibacter sp. KGMB00164]
MDQANHQLETFGALLRQYPQSSHFYDSCTPQQRQAILDQLSQLTSQAQLQGFVEHLPSAAL